MSKTQFTGGQLIELNETPSTNSLAMDLLEDNPPEGTVIWARHQSAGRGQKGNSWQVTPGQNLTFSLIYFPRFLLNREIFSLSKMVSVALYEALQIHFPSEEVKIKWPNDILINKQKVAGILIENQFEGSRLKGTVIGVGLNVNQLNFPDALKSRATSMQLVSGNTYDVQELLWEILTRLEAHYLRLRGGQKAALDRQYYDCLYGYQEVVALEVDGEIGDWMIVGVETSGRLAATQGKKIRYFNFKEVKFVFSD
jgi:BirA family biotin operon repressor/biotin-[acetyl-CoA-carboxylase] ligase